MESESDPNLDTETELPSKTQLKQEATELQQLGKKLTNYGSGFLQKLPISEKLISAIAEFNRLPNSHGARRRQLQFIGKLMRDCDYDLINRTIYKLENGTQLKNKQQSEYVVWCDRILLTGDVGINALLEQYPQLERQTLRALRREHSHASEGSKPKYERKLQTYLQQQLGN